VRARLVAASFAIAGLGAAAPAAADPPPDLPPVLAPPPSAPPAKPVASQPAPPVQAVPTFAPQPYPTWNAPGPFPPGYPGAAMPAYASPYNPAEYALPPPPPPRQRHNPAMYASGVALVVVGLSSVITGAALISTATNRIDVYCDTPSFPCAHLDDAPRRNGGIAVMAVGAAMAAVGMPLWIVGSKLVLIRPAPRAAPAAELRFGPAQARLAVSF
jgi:hypothetical protein